MAARGAGESARRNTPRASLSLLPTLGGAARPFLTPASLNPVWARDGSMLVFHHSTPGDPITLAEPDGQNERQIYKGASRRTQPLRDPEPGQAARLLRQELAQHRSGYLAHRRHRRNPRAAHPPQLACRLSGAAGQSHAHLSRNRWRRHSLGAVRHGRRTAHPAPDQSRRRGVPVSRGERERAQAGGHGVEPRREPVDRADHDAARRRIRGQARVRAGGPIARPTLRAGRTALPGRQGRYRRPLAMERRGGGRVVACQLRCRDCRPGCGNHWRAGLRRS